MKKPIVILTMTFVLVFAFCFSAGAENVTLDETRTNVRVNGACERISASVHGTIRGFYIEFTEIPVDMNVEIGGKTVFFEGKFINRYIDLTEYQASEAEVIFASEAYLKNVTVYNETPPADVQIWEDMCEEADLLLCTTHADDEQLYFAGVLPYYAAKGYDVQVVYFTDHKNLPSRRQELLAGLWEVGIRHYPLINGGISDKYSASLEEAVENLKADSKTYDDAVAFQVEVLRRFKPLVVVGHDLNGEYGHGQHILNSTSLTDAVVSAADPSAFPESAGKYGVWDTPKLYLHLYGENGIVMSDFDTPLDFFGGMSAFQMSQRGFSQHKSQLKTRFTTWLNGGDGSITRADQITTYSPLMYGLYRSSVGVDVNKNDFFENIPESYKQMHERLEREEEERIAREKAEEEARKAEEEARKAEEEARKAEESRLAEQTRQLDESRRADESGRATEDREKGSAITAVIAAVAVVSAAAAAVAIKFIRLKKK